MGLIYWVNLWGSFTELIDWVTLKSKFDGLTNAYLEPIYYYDIVCQLRYHCHLVKASASKPLAAY